jgi:DNA-binding response OmpR family regulator
LAQEALSERRMFAYRSGENMKPVDDPASKAGGSVGGKETGAGNVLVVDADARMLDLVRRAADSTAQVHLAASVDAAQVAMTRAPADVVLVNLQIADHAGTELIRTFKRKFPRTQIIAVSRSRRSEECLDAFRAGAADMLLAPFAPADVQKALEASAGRRAENERQRQRHERLRTVCRRLNKARHEISQQVDLLCNDLVRAYQEMAQQLNTTQTAADYAQALSGELDVEGVLRRTMEWILRKLGPLNAAIYLPSGDGQFSLGAYLNLDTQADAPLIEAIGRTIVSQARGSTALVVEDDKTMDELFGDDAELLQGRQWLAVGCLTPRECLGVLVVFRSRTAGMSGTTELSASARGLVEAAAPILAERIEQALGLYHRMHPFQEEDETEED